jgi:hypothetical protein
MKLRVQHKDGRMETLELHGTWTCAEGEILNRMTNENGFEHFFTPDGYYDGWGGCVTCPPSQTPDQLAKAREPKRKIE